MNIYALQKSSLEGLPSKEYKWPLRGYPYSLIDLRMRRSHKIETSVNILCWILLGKLETGCCLLIIVTLFVNFWSLYVASDAE